MLLVHRQRGIPARLVASGVVHCIDQLLTLYASLLNDSLRDLLGLLPTILEALLQEGIINQGGVAVR
ncbi:hypothetical protein D9M71_765570 [compost metagenome]